MFYSKSVMLSIHAVWYTRKQTKWCLCQENGCSLDCTVTVQYCAVSLGDSHRQAVSIAIWWGACERGGSVCASNLKPIRIFSTLLARLGGGIFMYIAQQHMYVCPTVQPVIQWNSYLPTRSPANHPAMWIFKQPTIKLSNQQIIQLFFQLNF